MSISMSAEPQRQVYLATGEFIDPLQLASIPTLDNNDGLTNMQNRVRSRSASRSGSTRGGLSDQVINEDEVFQPSETRTEMETAARSIQKFDDKNWSNLWGVSDIGSQMLENKGSVARDHMANERTFLSWMRTSLGLATAGVAVTQLFKIANDSGNKTDFLVRIGKPIGGCFISISILCILMGMMRFFKTQTLLQEDRYPAARISVGILVFLIFSSKLCVTTLVAVLHS